MRMLEWIQPRASVNISTPSLGRHYAWAGRRLWLLRSGKGNPAVVIIPGAGAVGLDYFNIHERASQTWTSVLYDRSGMGWSRAARPHRSAAATMDELRELLQLAEVKPPYVMVGHSLGGLFARRYVQRYPDEVVGLVLLDPAHEDYESRMPAQLQKLRAAWFMRMLSGVTGLALQSGVRLAPRLMERLAVIRRYRTLYRGLFAAEMNEWPEPLRSDLVERHVSIEWLWAGVREAQNAQRLYKEMRNAGPMPDVPMTILCSMGTDAFRRAVSMGESDALLAEELAAKRGLYEELAASVTHGEVRFVDAGHVTMSFRHPEAVQQAIADLLLRRSDSPVPQRAQAGTPR